MDKRGFKLLPQIPIFGHRMPVGVGKQNIEKRVNNFIMLAKTVDWLLPSPDTSAVREAPHTSRNRTKTSTTIQIVPKSGLFLDRRRLGSEPHDQPNASEWPRPDH